MKLKLIITICILSLIVLVGCSKVNINYAVIRPDMVAEGNEFNFVFNIVNEWEVEGYVNYSYMFNPSCIEINGSEKGQLYLRLGVWSNKERRNNPFYTPFYVKNNLSWECYGNEQHILLIIENSEKILSTEQVDFWIALDTLKIQEVERYKRLNVWR